jgi:translocation and assembly module TamB
LVRASRQENIDLNGTRTDVTAGVDVTGTARKPEITVFSEPPMEERDAMSVLITGNTAQNFNQGTGSIGVDKQVTDKLSVGAELDQESSSTEFVTKYRINRKLHVEATTSSRSSAADVFYSIEFD